MKSQQIKQQTSVAWKVNPLILRLNTPLVLRMKGKL